MSVPKFFLKIERRNVTRRRARRWAAPAALPRARPLCETCCLTENTMGSTRTVERAVPIQPPQFARRIWIGAWQGLCSACFARANNRHDCFVLGILVFLTSLNYWRHPVHGWRRNVDIVAALIALGYQVGFVAPYASCPRAAAAYALSIAVRSLLFSCRSADARVARIGFVTSALTVLLCVPL